MNVAEWPPRSASSRLRRSRHLLQRPWTAALALTCVAVLFAGCGSRLSDQAIASAAHKPIVQGSGSSAGAGDVGSTGAQALGADGGPCSSTTTTTSAPDKAKSKSSSSTSSTTTTAPCSSTALASGASGSHGGVAGSGASSAAARTATGSGGSAGGGGSAAANGSTIALGNVGTYSGVIGAVFSGAQQTMGVWQAYVNAHGGLNGHPVHVYIEDDGADPSTSVSDVEQEVTQDHVVAFVGNLVPLTASASVSYLQQKNIPVIGGDASSATWWQSPVYFPQGGSDLWGLPGGLHHQGGGGTRRHEDGCRVLRGGPHVLQRASRT